jgi:hypothetical protein
MSVERQGDFAGEKMHCSLIVTRNISGLTSSCLHCLLQDKIPECEDRWCASGYLVAHDLSIPCSVPMPLSERPANMIAQALGRIVLYPVL